MALGPFVANFHGGTPAAVTGKFINNYQGISAGSFETDFINYDDNSLTGVSGSAVRALTATTSGRATSSPLTDLSTAINTQGSFTTDSVNNPSNNTFTYTFPLSVTSVDVDIFLCTTFTNQTDIDVTVNGSQQTAFDSTNNTTGTFLTFSGVVPNGSGEVVIFVENDIASNNDFTVNNGHSFYNIVSPSGVTVDVPVGSMTLAGQVPTVIADIDITVNVPAGAMALTGQAPTVLIGTNTIIDVPVGALAFAGSSPTISTSGFVNDTFDGTGALNPQWELYDNSGGGVTSVGRVNNYFEGTVSDNTTNQTLWFDTDQGRFDYQTVTVPASGTDEYILAGAGVGPTGAPLDNLPFLTSQFSFCGLMVHDNTLTNVDYMFSVIGHRGGANESTVEIKGTQSGVSVADDEGGDVFGTGVTHGDLRVEIQSTGVALFSYRPLSGGAWTYINTGNTGLVPNSYNLGAPGTSFKIGIIGYAFNSVGVPFKFTADSMELIDPNELVSVPDGSLTIVGQIPVVLATDNANINIPAGALSINSFAPFIDLGNQTIIPNSGIMTFQGFAPNLIDSGSTWEIQQDSVTNWSIQ